MKVSKIVWISMSLFFIAAGQAWAAPTCKKVKDVAVDHEYRVDRDTSWPNTTTEYLETYVKVTYEDNSSNYRSVKEGGSELQQLAQVALISGKTLCYEQVKDEIFRKAYRFNLGQ